MQLVQTFQQQTYNTDFNMSTSISIKTDSKCHDSLSESYERDDSSSSCPEQSENLGGVTDAEDFDSYSDTRDLHSRKSSKTSSIIAMNLSDTYGGVTDVEDYIDSESGKSDSKSIPLPDIKLSLQEFMQNDFEEHLSITNNGNEIIHYKCGNFFQAQSFGTLSDNLTDYEDFYTDSEVEENCNKSCGIDLEKIAVQMGNVFIAELATTKRDIPGFDCDNDEISVVSDVSGVVSALSDFAATKIQHASEDEFLEFSSNAEICQISSSDSDSISKEWNSSEEDLQRSATMPPMDVIFIHDTNGIALENDAQVQHSMSRGCVREKNIFLHVEKKKVEEIMTDTERFEDSIAESGSNASFESDDNNQRHTNHGIIDDGACITDCEDLFYDDVSETVVSDQISALSVDFNVIPSPQREVVTLQEDKFGDTIVSVMPMSKDYQFGIYDTQRNEYFTDTEEYSCTDDMELQADLPSHSPLPNLVVVESDVTVANELLKTQQSKRLDIISNNESLTDIEEIFMAGTISRKKRTRYRVSIKKNPKLLYKPIPSTAENSTDMEDMDFSENGLLAPITCDKNLAEPSQSINSSQNVIVTLETCESVTSVETNVGKNAKGLEIGKRNCITTKNNLQHQQTNVEFIKYMTGIEESMNISVSAADCVCHDLNEMFSESFSTVHDKCGNSFNADAETLHIKSVPRESHTDIEYLESDESAARGSK